MRNRTKGLRFPPVGVLVALCLWLPPIVAESSEKPPAEPGARVFTLEEVSLQDCPEPARSRLQNGTNATEWGENPYAGITYPAFQSKRPIYGIFTFDMSLFDPQAGLRYGFAVDESAGTGTGYDRLYFDLNHDSDLTNDAAVAALKEAPAGMSSDPLTVWFEKIQVRLDYGPEGVWTQAVLPRLMKLKDRGLPFFVVPTARKGKIILGSEEVELILSQRSTIPGRYDRPMIEVFLIGKQELLPVAGAWRNVKGTFYKLSPSPAGDKVVVEPYSGPLGTFELSAGGRNLAPSSLALGFLLSKNTVIDLAACQSANGKWTVPVGDYRPMQLSVRCGQRRIGLRADVPQPGAKAAEPATFPLRIRQDKPCVLDFSDKPQVAFRSPSAGQRVRPGDTLKVEAALLLPASGTIIANLEDTTRKTGGVKLPDGRELDMFASVAPKVKIVDASGRTLAEGEMPFGWGGTCGYSWRVPNDLKLDANQETLTIQVTCDTQEFYGTITGTQQFTLGGQ